MRKQNWLRQSFRSVVLAGLVSTILFTSIGLKAAGNLSSLMELDRAALIQGGLVVGQIKKPGWHLILNDRQLKTDRLGRFVFGIGRDHPPQLELILQNDQGIRHKAHFPVRARQWKIERIDGLPQEKVSPRKPEELARISREATQVKTARNRETSLDFFSQTFRLPAIGRVSGVYGSQRILNGQPKRPHYGLDIANKPGTPVMAPADGVITLAEKDLFFSGGTIIMDHGYGVSSTFLHLQDVLVAPGQKIKKGEIIGRIGSTGRSSGPHLDWRINWFQVRLDPALLVADAPEVKLNHQQ